MKFDYLKQPNFSNPNQPWVSRPVIPVKLSRNGKSVQVYALLDSGADSSLFHVSLANELGIDLRSGSHQNFFGISGGAGIDASIHKIRIQVIGDPDPFEIEVGFTDSPGVGAILGQRGFFDHYQVRFERAKEKIELLPPKK